MVKQKTRFTFPRVIDGRTKSFENKSIRKVSLIKLKRIQLLKCTEMK